MHATIEKEAEIYLKLSSEGFNIDFVASNNLQTPLCDCGFQYCGVVFICLTFWLILQNKGLYITCLTQVWFCKSKVFGFRGKLSAVFGFYDDFLRFFGFRTPL